MQEKILDMKVSDMPGYSYMCSCGKRHSIDIKKILIGKGTVLQLPQLLKEFKDKDILVVSDKNTYPIAGEQVINLLTEAGYHVESLIMSTENYPTLIPNQAALGDLMINITEKTGLVIAAGSGTLNDICKIVTYKMGLPSVTVGTAPSMDGYASTMTPLVLNRNKVTYPSHYPYAVVADPDIMKTAPDVMFTAGFGDIVGKYTALSDWKLTVDVNGEYFCPVTEKLMRNAVDKCVNNMEAYFNRETEGIDIMNEALMLAGITMGLVGITRPASGSEHHLAHFWELDMIAKGIEHPLHGNSVGLASIASAEVYDIMSQRFEQVSKINAPKPDFLRNLYAKAGSALYPDELGVSKELFEESLNNGYRIRPRYTIFNYTFEKGMLSEISRIVTERMFKRG